MSDRDEASLRSMATGASASVGKRGAKPPVARSKAACCEAARCKAAGCYATCGAGAAATDGCTDMVVGRAHWACRGSHFITVPLPVAGKHSNLETLWSLAFHKDFGTAPWEASESWISDVASFPQKLRRVAVEFWIIDLTVLRATSRPYHVLRFPPPSNQEQQRQLTERENVARAREVAALGREQVINEERAVLERHRLQQREYEVQQNTRDRALADREAALQVREQAVVQCGRRTTKMLGR